MDFDFIFDLGPLRMFAAYRGHVEFINVPTNHPHAHPNHHELCLVLSGQGLFEHGDEVYPLKAGDIFFSELKEAHEISSMDSYDLVLCFFDLRFEQLSSGTICDQQSQRLQRFLKQHQLHTSTNHGLEHLISFIDSNQFSMNQKSALYRDVIQSFLLSCFDYLSHSVNHEVSGSIYIRSCKQRLLERMAYPIDVEDLANHVGCSSRHLNREMQKYHAMSVQQFAILHKIDHAKALLNMNFRIAEVADAVGMDPAQFSRSFKKAFGCTPREFQQGVNQS
ncbi:MAG: AraC family transcriptional regulator [Lentisphaeria bacterium]|nr:AraC family transcriptional regulator [Lentisphaeria bacterium]